MAHAVTLPEFRDDAASAGLRFVFDNGQSPLRQLPETTAGGVGLLDYDGDGWLDVYVVQGCAFPPDPSRPFPPATVCSATAAMARLKTPPNGPASPG